MIIGASIDGTKVQDAMRNMAIVLCNAGYIDSKEKKALIYGIDIGDLESLWKIRSYTMKMADDFAAVAKKK